MNTRFKIILNLMKKANGKASRLCLVKWAFLLAKEYLPKRNVGFYDFLPYKYGPFSFALYHEIDAAVDNGYLNNVSDHDLQLTPVAEPSLYRLDSSLREDVEFFWMRYGKLSATDLLDDVYQRYPWFTLNSDLKEKRKAKAPRTDPAVYTVGYEHYQIDGFLNLLLRSGVRKVIDIRANPVSRVYGYHKSTLSGLCQRLSLEYQHVPELGIPSAWRVNLMDDADYIELFSRYVKEILPKSKNELRLVAQWMNDTPSVLLCYEKDPNHCHRWHAAQQVSELAGLSVKHLGN